MNRVKLTLLSLVIGASFFLGGCSLVEGKIPEPTNYIVDQAGVIDDKVESKLNEELKNFDKGEISLLTIKSIQPESIEQFGIDLADKWKVGKKGEDNGVILIFVTEDKRVRLELGKGTEALITDSQAGEILDKYVIHAKEDGDWTAAAENSIHSIMLKMGGDPSKIATPSATSDTGDALFIIIIIIIIIIVIIFCAYTDSCDDGELGGLFGGGSSGSSGGGFGFGGGGFGGGGASR